MCSYCSGPVFCQSEKSAIPFKTKRVLKQPLPSDRERVLKYISEKIYIFF